MTSLPSARADTEDPGLREGAKLRRRDLFLGALAAGVGASALLGCRDGGKAEPKAPTIAPAALAARVGDIKSGKIAVFYVGPRALFGRGHVPGAKALPEIDSSDGPAALKAAMASTPDSTEIVVYCGCCPVRNCPNVRPAGEAIRASGRTNMYLLDLPTRFSDDWSDKGYPVERS